MDIIINSEALATSISDLNNRISYFKNKGNTFRGGAFNSTSLLSSYLNNLNKTYTSLANNLTEIKDFLNDYKSDITGLENKMSANSGTIKTPAAASLANNYANSLTTTTLNNSLLFQINSLSSQPNTSSKTSSKESDSLKVGLANVGVGTLSFAEGILNVGEMLIDGGGVLASNVCSIFGNTKGADSIMQFVKKDLSDDWYHDTTKALGIDKYTDVDSGLSQGFKIAGNVTGSILLGIATSGLGNAVGGALGGCTTATKVATIAGNVLTSSAINSGAEAESAMKYGASTKDALISANAHALSGAAFGALTGHFTNLAKTSTGLAELGKYTISAALTSTGEPIINEMIKTGTYKKDTNLNLWQNFLKNAEEDGLLLQMGLTGVTNAGITFANGLISLKSNKLDSTVPVRVTAEIPQELNEHQINIKMREMNELLEDEKLKSLYAKYQNNENIKIPTRYQEKIKVLTTLNEEITSKKGLLSDVEVKIYNKELLENIAMDTFLDPSTSKKLTDFEIQVKKNEYFNLLEENYNLKYYLNGEKMVLDEDLARKILAAKRLEMEITSGIGEINSEEEKLVTKLLNNQIAGRNLKNEIISSATGIEDPITRAKKIYMELNKKLHYDLDYAKGNESIKNRIYNNALSFESINESNSVICKSWSELYKEALIAAGIPEDSIKIMNTGGDLSHRWIEISLGDRIIIADATEPIKTAGTDLAKAKAGLATTGFAVLDKEYSGTRLYTAYKKGVFSPELIQAQENLNLNIDQNLGYATSDGYLMDQLNKANALFANSTLTSSVITNPSEVLDEVLKMDIPENMDGLEVFVYFDKLSKGALSKSALSDLEYARETLFQRGENGIEAIFHMSYNNNGTKNHFLYSPTLGKLTFNSDLEFAKFRENTKIWK